MPPSRVSSPPSDTAPLARPQGEGIGDTSQDYAVILIPVYKDWPAVQMLLDLLDQAFCEAGVSSHRDGIRVLLVDDGSMEPIPDGKGVSLRALRRVDILRLRRNVGHQRAIAVGLTFIGERLPCRAVVVMDGDGEDRPEHVPILLRRFEEVGGAKAVFSERARRTESLAFRGFYVIYKALHRLLTGERVRVGNFSALPFAFLSPLSCVSDVWNHYAAAVFKARLPVDMLPLPRGHRLAGRSRMNFVSLVIHGLSAMSVYGDRIGVRLLSGTCIAIVATLTGLAGLATAHFAFRMPVPTWTVIAAAALAFLLSQALLLSLVFVFIVLAGRDSSAFLPVRDYAYFIDALVPLHGANRPPDTLDAGGAVADRRPEVADRAAVP